MEFTIHYMTDSGGLDGQLASDDVKDGTQPWISRHASTARKRAATAARFLGRNMAVVRNGDRVAYVIGPDGRVSTPPGVTVAERENCTRGSGRPCFCTACRAERKAGRL